MVLLITKRRQLFCSDCQSTMQHELFRFSNVRSAARVAASKTSSTPSPVKDEHSRYFLAPIWFAVSPPSLGVTNRSDFFLISSIASGSSRRSFFRPTKIMGTPGHRSFASSTHCDCFQSILTSSGSGGSLKPTLCLTFSKLSGVSMENPIRMTWALEYAMGRNRS